MFQHQIKAASHMCPDCGSRLSSERDLLRCETHGAFFVYGSQLLVRAPEQERQLPDTLLPWENQGRRQVR